MTARDIRYGRRGGGWVDGQPIDPTPCDVCNRPVTTGGDRHQECTTTPTLFSVTADADSG